MYDEFSNNFIDGITKTDRSILVNYFRVMCFGDKGDKCCIKVFTNSRGGKGSVTSVYYCFFCLVPNFLEKK